MIKNSLNYFILILNFIHPTLTIIGLELDIACSAKSEKHEPLWERVFFVWNCFGIVIRL
jgi:hypothetical protein